VVGVWKWRQRRRAAAAAVVGIGGAPAMEVLGVAEVGDKP
jgi:hypothetical protein